MKTRVSLIYFVNDCSISDLATSSELTVIEYKIPDVSSLVKKTDFDAELKKISDKVTSNKP